MEPENLNFSNKDPQKPPRNQEELYPPRQEERMENVEGQNYNVEILVELGLHF